MNAVRWDFKNKKLGTIGFNIIDNDSDFAQSINTIDLKVAGTAFKPIE